MSQFHLRIGLLLSLALALSACSAGPASLSAKDMTYTALVMTLSAPAATSLPSASPTESPTLESSTTLATSITPSRTATRPAAAPGPLCDDSAYVSDVTIPDGTKIDPGDSFTKTWSIRNTGACSWTTAYSIDFVQGNAMDGVRTYLSASVDPGGTVEISVGLAAPTTPGKYTGYWRLKNADGNFFGELVYVQIVVSGSGTTTPSMTLLETNTPAPEITDTPLPTDTEIPVT